ncbi:MAG: M6 family metalloprotease domain-containing protein [Endomicrobiia bacterium]|nr:M6 family metalloprotease domain-containing protein [Endomicrobiia bacterium]
MTATIAICAVLPASALIPADGRPRPGRFRDGVSKKPDPIKLRRLGYSAPEIRMAIGSGGTQKVAVVFINFPSAGVTTSGSRTITNYASIITNISSMTHFYNEASYGKLILEFTCFPSTYSSVVAPKAMEYYSNENAHLLIRSAIDLSGVTKSSYDAVMVVHAGYGQESSSKDGDIFSAFYPENYFPAAVNGFREGFVVPEFESPGLSPFGVYVHEMGHQLGLPDFYNTDTGKTVVGNWCLMDAGPWAGDGKSPSHPSVWCKNYLGWLEVSTAASSGEYSLAVVSSSSEALKIPMAVASNPSSEFFLVEYRRSDDTSSNYDKKIPGSGVLIWHIDDSVGSVYDNNVNNFSPPRVGLVPADSTYPADNYGDATDAWPGSRTTFSDPYSRAYNGSVSGIAAANFRNHPSSSTFSVDNIAVAATFGVARMTNYPNPAGKGFLHPRPGVLTTINFKMTRPAQTMSLAIYNITGERILSVPKSSFNIRIGGAQIGASSDENWVYEYDWDGKDSSGYPAAPGIYLYRLRADGQLKTGKMVVER